MFTLTWLVGCDSVSHKLPKKTFADEIKSVDSLLYCYFGLQSPSVTPRKPLQSDNTSHSQDDDSYSVTSSYPFFVAKYCWLH
jgi:hypothetical protein